MGDPFPAHAEPHQVCFWNSSKSRSQGHSEVQFSHRNCISTRTFLLAQIPRSGINTSKPARTQLSIRSWVSNSPGKTVLNENLCYWYLFFKMKPLEHNWLHSKKMFFVIRKPDTMFTVPWDFSCLVSPVPGFVGHWRANDGNRHVHSSHRSCTPQNCVGKWKAQTKTERNTFSCICWMLINKGSLKNTVLEGKMFSFLLKQKSQSK